MKRFLVLVFSFSLLFLSASAFALQKVDTTGEHKLFPPFCQPGITQTNPGPWKKAIPVEFKDILHYCAGIKYYNRAIKSWDQKQAQLYNLSNAEDHFRYMLRNEGKPGVVLVPSVYYYLGMIYKMRRDYTAFVRSLHKAIQLKPTMIKAYRELGDHYSNQGQVKMAKKIIDQGLKHKPKSKSLKRRLKKIESQLKQ